MSDRVVKIPGPNHPIAVEKIPGQVVVRVAGRKIAATNSALSLREATLPPVTYIPRTDIDVALLERSHHSTYCPYKGDASYFSIPVAGDIGENIAWSYEAPHPAMAVIKDHVAFYADRVAIGDPESNAAER